MPPPKTRCPARCSTCRRPWRRTRSCRRTRTSWICKAQLKDLETKIAYARQFYNDVVLKYNTKIETVPSNIIAGMFHFEQAQYFQADEGSRQVPQVRF